MFRKTLPALSLALLASMLQLHAQKPAPAPAQNQPAAISTDKIDDKPEPNRFWQASLSGGHYMVALERISAISRHKYLIAGGALVDEVTVDALGQGLVRFYLISPPTDAMTGTSAGNAASRIVDRGRELVDKVAQTAGTDAHNMVIKMPEDTHARSIEFRVQSEQELGALYSSVRTAWENGKGRKFTIK